MYGGRCFRVHLLAEVRTMVAYRARAGKPALALWLVVLGIDGAAVGTVAALVYILAAIVAGGLVFATLRCRGRLEPQPVRVHRR
jgi:hypothetical protein